MAPESYRSRTSDHRTFLSPLRGPMVCLLLSQGLRPGLRSAAPPGLARPRIVSTGSAGPVPPLVCSWCWPFQLPLKSVLPKAPALGCRIARNAPFHLGFGDLRQSPWGQCGPTGFRQSATQRSLLFEARTTLAIASCVLRCCHSLADDRSTSRKRHPSPPTSRCTGQLTGSHWPMSRRADPEHCRSKR